MKTLNYLVVMAVFLSVGMCQNAQATTMFTDRFEWEKAVQDIGYKGTWDFDYSGGYEYKIKNIDFEEVGQSTFDGFTWQIDAGDVSYNSYGPIFVTEPSWFYPVVYDSGKGLYPFYNSTTIQVNLPTNTFAFGFDLVEFHIPGDWEVYPPVPQMNSIVLSNGYSFGGTGRPYPDISFFGFISPFAPITGMFMNASSDTEPFYDNFSYAQAVKPVPVPEPATLLLFMIGFTGLMVSRHIPGKAWK